MKTLIIGAGGFVGPYLAEAVKYNLYCDVVATKLGRENFIIPGCRIENLDIMDTEAIYQMLVESHPQYIFHLAAQSSVAYSWKNPSLTVDVNIKGALNLLNAVRRLHWKPRVLIIGSGEEYGHIASNAVPIVEDEFLRPGNIYAATKVCQNMMATIYSQAYDMQLVMTRSFNHMGPRQTPIFVVSDFCSQVVKIENKMQEPVIRVGNLNSKRDFTDVRDVVKAYCALIQFGKAGETYNVGTGHAYEVRFILDKILEQSKVKITVEIDPDKLRPVDVPIIEPDTEKIYKATGWKPVISLEKTISDMLGYWRENIDLLGGAK